MSKTYQIKVSFTQTQLRFLEQEADMRGMSVSSFLRHIVRLYKGDHKVEGNPYLKTAERHGFIPPESRHDER